MKNGITKRGSTYSYVLRVPDPINGGTKPRWVGGFATEREAKAARDKDRVALSAGTFVNPAKMTLGEYLDHWIAIHSHTLKPSTASSYRGHIRLYLKPQLGKILLQDLRPTHIQKMYVHLITQGGSDGAELSARTVQFTGAILIKALKHAVEVDGLLASNPANKVPRPRSASKTNQPYTPEQIKILLEALEANRLFALFRLAVYSGARLGELLALSWSDVDFEKGSIVISKNRVVVERSVLTQNSTKGGEGRRIVSLDAKTLEILKNHKQQQIRERLVAGANWVDLGLLFVNELGKPTNSSTPGQIFQRVREKLGLPSQRFHDLRHFHATQLLQAGVPLHVVAQRLGHRDAMVTATIYAHVTSEQGENVSQVFSRAIDR